MKISEEVTLFSLSTSPAVNLFLTVTPMRRRGNPPQTFSNRMYSFPTFVNRPNENHQPRCRVSEKSTNTKRTAKLRRGKPTQQNGDF